MDFSQLKKEYDSRVSGVPKKFSNRVSVNASDVSETFTNDSPVIIVRKPKNAQDKVTKQWNRVLSKKTGKPLFQDVAYIPALMESGEYVVIVTTTDKTVNVLRQLMQDVEPVLTKGESFDDINRWEEYEAEEIIEGTLCFKSEKTEYRDGKMYNVAVLSAVDTQ